MNLEELLELDTDGNGEAVSPAVHYLGGQTVGEYMLDQIMSGCEYTGWQRTVVSPAFVDEASRAMSSFLRVAQPQGAGGVDFLSAGGKPFLTDVNSGRFNGAHRKRLLFFCDAIFYSYFKTEICQDRLGTADIRKKF